MVKNEPKIIEENIIELAENGTMTTDKILVLHLLGVLPVYNNVDDVASFDSEVLLLLYHLKHLSLDEVSCGVISSKLFTQVMAKFKFTNKDKSKLNNILDNLEEFAETGVDVGDAREAIESIEYLKYLIAHHYKR